MESSLYTENPRQEVVPEHLQCTLLHPGVIEETKKKAEPTRRNSEVPIVTEVAQLLEKTTYTQLSVALTKVQRHERDRE